MMNIESFQRNELRRKNYKGLPFQNVYYIVLNNKYINWGIIEFYLYCVVNIVCGIINLNKKYWYELN